MSDICLNFPYDRNAFRDGLTVILPDTIRKLLTVWRSFIGNTDFEVSDFIDRMANTIFDLRISAGRATLFFRIPHISEPHRKSLVMQLYVYWWRRTDRIYVAIRSEAYPSENSKAESSLRLTIHSVSIYRQRYNRLTAMYACSRGAGQPGLRARTRVLAAAAAMSAAVPERHARYMEAIRILIERRLRHLVLPGGGVLRCYWERPFCALVVSKDRPYLYLCTPHKCYLIFTNSGRVDDLDLISAQMGEDGFLLPAYLQAETREQLEELLRLRREYSSDTTSVTATLPISVSESELSRSLYDATCRALHGVRCGLYLRYPLPIQVPFFVQQAVTFLLQAPAGRMLWRRISYAVSRGNRLYVKGAAVELVWLRTEQSLKYRVSCNTTAMSSRTRIGDEQTGYVYVVCYKDIQQASAICRLLDLEQEKG